MSVCLENIPAKRAPFAGQRFHRHLSGCWSVVLVAIDVKQRDQTVQLVMRRCFGRFPDLAFIQLAITEHDISFAVPAMDPGAQGHAGSGRQADAQ